MRDTTGRNAPQVEEARRFAKDNNVDLRTIELDVASQASADTAIQTIVSENKRLDVVIHNAKRGSDDYGNQRKRHGI
jgi:NAD(P)-dependent dehydrogenase (short-subunit alcohol dehydrogenase family)